MVAIILLVIFYLFDSFYYKKENLDQIKIVDPEPIRLEGAFNLFFLLGVVGGVLFSGIAQLGEVTVFGIHIAIQSIMRDVWIVIMGLLSLRLTTQRIRKANDFSWFPIQEVAYLFAGIFMTIIPALAILKAGEKGSMAAIILAVDTPSQFFWITGTLSSFLDNAPTYLTFFNTALGKLGLTEPIIREAFAAGTFSSSFPEFESLLVGISLGAVFMGANTYIGNAPNFMVKSIAEESGINMPSFFGYMIKYSIPILVPVFFIIALIFL